MLFRDLIGCFSRQWPGNLKCQSAVVKFGLLVPLIWNSLSSSSTAHRSLLSMDFSIGAPLFIGLQQKWKKTIVATYRKNTGKAIDDLNESDLALDERYLYNVSIVVDRLQD